jgi:hypothetical protein
MAEWERVVAALEKKHMTLAGVYAHARLVGWQGRKIELAFAQGTLQGSLGADADNVAKMKAFLTEHFAAPMDLAVKTLANMPAPAPRAASAGSGDEASGSGASLAEVEHERRRAEREKREQEARQHPTTQAALDVFAASIKEIKVDG